MKRSIKGALAALAIFGVGAVASADVITTSSTGTFSAVAPDTGTGTSTLATPAGTTLTYTGTTDFSGDVTKIVTLGSFSLATTSLTGDVFNPADDFTVDIAQVVTPGVPGSGTSTGDVVTVGTIHPGSGGAEVISFLPNPVTIGGKSYLLLTATVSGPTATGPLGAGSGLLQALLTNPTAGPGTPLPASALGGAGLLALLAFGKARQKLRA